MKTSGIVLMRQILIASTMSLGKIFTYAEKLVVNVKINRLEI